MNNSKFLLTTNYHVGLANSFINSLDEAPHYFFVGNSVDSNSTITQPQDKPEHTIVNAYYDMIFGKKITSSNASKMIRRVNWEANTVYSTYDHTNDSLYEDDFYVIVLEGSQYDVFKCLENGSDSASIVAPSRLNVGSDNEDFYYANDGYRWKYMYSVSDEDASKWATNDYFPVVTDEGVKSNAIAGAIDVIKIANSGSGYDNYISGSFGINDIRLNGDTKKYGISASGAKTVNTFYNACYLYITSGAGSGQYRMIDSYVSNSTHNYVFINTPFDADDDPENGSSYEITPSLDILGDGKELITAEARAIIDPSGNTVSRIEMLRKGQNYNFATASVQAANAVGVTTEAGVVPIYSPSGGHGYNSETELGGHYASLSLSVVRDESNTVLVENNYSQIGIVKNPLFNKVTLDLINNNRDFSVNEYVYKIEPIQLQGTISTTKNGNGVLTATVNTSVNAYSIATIGNQLFFHYGNEYMIANVAGVANTYLTLDKAAIFDTGANTANVFIANVRAEGLVDGISSAVVDMTNVNGVFAVGDKLIGSDTGTYAEIDSFSISGRDKNFNTFLQCYTYIGSIVQGTFTGDETITQNSSSARFHSSNTNGANTYIYTTNQIGGFNTLSDDTLLSDQIIGESSGAIASLSNKYLPDLVFGSGEVLYIENGESITRSTEYSETFKLIIAF